MKYIVLTGKEVNEYDDNFNFDEEEEFVIFEDGTMYPVNGNQSLPLVDNWDFEQLVKEYEDRVERE